MRETFCKAITVLALMAGLCPGHSWAIDVCSGGNGLDQCVITVDTPVDIDIDIDQKGRCTLREALQNANVHSKWNFKSTCGRGGNASTTIKLPALIGLDPSLDRLQVASEVILTGTSTVDGGGKMQLFRVGSSGSLTINGNVTLTGGFAPDAEGGCILVDAGGNLTLTDTTLRICHAQRGGAIGAFGNVLATRVNFEFNTADIEGGAIWIGNSSQVFIANSLFNSNRAADGSGGGIFILPGDANFNAVNSVFVNNYSDGVASNVGGGGIYLGGSPSFGQSLISACLFRQNGSRGGLGGGGLYVNSSVTVEVTDSVFVGNVGGTLNPDSSGGGMHIDGTAIVDRSNFNNNLAWSGGGISVVGPNASLQLINTTLTGNLADKAASGNNDGEGAALLSDDADHVDIINSTIAFNNGRSQLFARNSTQDNSIVFTNTVIDAGPESENCAWDSVKVSPFVAPTKFNAQRMDLPETKSGTCPGIAPFDTSVAMLAANTTKFIIDIGATGLGNKWEALQHLTIWPVPNGVLIGTGDPATCKDPKLTASKDERRAGRGISCELGAIAANNF